MTTWWNEPGAAATGGGVGPPIQWMRWSCQMTVRPLDSFTQSGAALASANGGIAPSDLVALRYVAGERRLRYTPSGPMRR